MIERINGLEVFKSESWLEPADLKIKSLWEWTEPEDTPLKISISGAGGTGKKELAKRLGSKLDLPVLDSVARTLHRLDFKLNKSSSFETQVAAFLATLNAALDYEDELVSAGSLIDVLAYMKYITDRTDDSKIVSMGRAMGNVVQSLIYDVYAVFIYLPLVEKPKPDSLRSVDMKFQQEIDTNIRYFLNAFDIDYFPIAGTDKEKFDRAIDYLAEFQLLIDRDL
jgi:hypothetical protein